MLTFDVDAPLLALKVAFRPGETELFEYKCYLSQQKRVLLPWVVVIWPLRFRFISVQSKFQEFNKLLRI